MSKGEYSWTQHQIRNTYLFAYWVHDSKSTFKFINNRDYYVVLKWPHLDFFRSIYYVHFGLHILIWQIMHRVNFNITTAVLFSIFVYYYNFGSVTYLDQNWRFLCEIDFYCSFDCYAFFYYLFLKFSESVVSSPPPFGTQEVKIAGFKVHRKPSMR